MAKSKQKLSGNAPMPQWYWTDGLHDACIIGVEASDFSYDYNRYVREQDAYDRNMLSLKIDASGALYARDIRQIRLFNYKILTPHIQLQGRKEIWWMGDRLTEKDGCYILEIDLQDLAADPKDFIWKIRFERAEVDRA